MQETHSKILTVDKSKLILLEYGLPVNKSVLVTSVNQIEEVCSNLHFPLVMKIVSPQIIHKTDVGGVLLNLQSVAQVVDSFLALTESIRKQFPSYDISGVVLEEQVPEGIEFVAGVLNDKVFGSCLMFGLGGIFVEVIKDISFRLIPASKDDIISMMQEIKFAPILNGMRGKNINTNLLQELLLKLSSFAFEHPTISEIDLNPIIATNNRVVIVDARIILKD